MLFSYFFFFFFFNDTATTEIYTLSLHDALPIFMEPVRPEIDTFVLDWITREPLSRQWFFEQRDGNCRLDRKSTRLNSSHLVISYAVFCLKKKKNTGKSLDFA